MITVGGYDGSSYHGSVIKGTNIVNISVSSSEASGTIGEVSSGDSGKFYGFFQDSADLPSGSNASGYAYVGTDSPFSIWNYDGETWEDSGVTHAVNGGGIEQVNVSVDDTVGTPAASVSFNDGDLSIDFTGLKGPQGNSGYSGAAGELEVVNNFTDGGATAALSAEMGKELYDELGIESTESVSRYIYPTYFGNYYTNTSITANSGFWTTNPIRLYKGETISFPSRTYQTIATVNESDLPLSTSTPVTRRDYASGTAKAISYTATAAEEYIIYSCDRNVVMNFIAVSSQKSLLNLTGLDTRLTSVESVLSQPKTENISLSYFAQEGYIALYNNGNNIGYCYFVTNSGFVTTTPISMRQGDTLNVELSSSTLKIYFGQMPSGAQTSSTLYPLLKAYAIGETSLSLVADKDMDVIFSCNKGQVLSATITHATSPLFDNRQLSSVVDDNSIVTNSETDVCLIMGSSLTYNAYSPKTLSWIERVNDLIDIGIINGGHSGGNLADNITDMTTGSIVLPKASLQEIAPKFIVSNNDANSTPTGASLDSQLKQFADIAKSVGAEVLVCGEEPTLIDAGKYNRQCVMTMQGVNYYPTALLWYDLNRTQPYKGWKDSSLVHSNFKDGSSHVSMIEMLKDLPIWKSVKMFKVRENYKGGSPTTSELVYTSNSERALIWRGLCPAIGNGTSPWANDNIDGIGYIDGETPGVSLMTDTNIGCEVLTSKGGGYVAFYHHALIEIITPRIGVSSVKIEIQCDSTPTGVGYIVQGVYKSLTTTYADGVISFDINDALLQDYDKIRIIVSDTTDSSFRIGKCSVNIYDGSVKPFAPIQYRGRKSGTELMTKTSVETGWTFTGNASVKSLPSSVANYTLLNNVGSHIQLDDDSAKAVYTQSLGHTVHKVAVRIAACIFPNIQTKRTSNDYTTTTQDIFLGMYYGGNLVLTINDAYIPLHIECGWMEVYTEAVIDSSSLSIELGRLVDVDTTMNVGDYPVIIHNVSVQEI